MVSCMKPVIFYSVITFSYTKCFVHSYTVDVVFTLSYATLQLWHLKIRHLTAVNRGAVSMSQMWNSERYFGNSLVAKRATQCVIMGRPLRLWVAFGDRTTVFGQHCYWHGMKRMWADRMLDPYCDFELWPHPGPWPLVFMVKFWKSCNSGMGCPIMEWKGCESTECWTHVVTFNFELTHDLDLEFSMSNFKIAASQEWEGRLTWNERIWIDRVVNLLCDLELWPWPWIFKVKLWKWCISGMGGSIDMEPKGCESIGC